MRIFPDVTQSGAAEGASIDSTNITAWGNASGPARSIQSALISMVVRGSSAIFSRASASQFYLDIEQLSVMHFLDATSFQNVIALLRANNAFSVITDPQTQKPRIAFTEQALAQCNRLSCNLHNNIYGGSVARFVQIRVVYCIFAGPATNSKKQKIQFACIAYVSWPGHLLLTARSRPAAVHSFATGIGSTSTDGTRDWLLSNVLQATDDYSRDLATNMTTLLRSKYDVDDRIRKAWFINPANKWSIQSTGAQSRLLLSDKMIMYAVIVLKDGNGKIMRRRLLSFSSSSSDAGTKEMVPISDTLVAGEKQEVQITSRHLLQQTSSSVTTITEQQVAALLQQMQGKPRTGVIPPLDFRVSVPYTLASIYGVEQKLYLLLDIGAVGLFEGSQWTQQEVNDEFMRRVLSNQKVVCPDCSGIYPAFSNMRPEAQPQSMRRRRRRNLLQSTTAGTTKFAVRFLLICTHVCMRTNNCVARREPSPSFLSTTKHPWGATSTTSTLQMSPRQC